MKLVATCFLFAFAVDAQEQLPKDTSYEHKFYVERIKKNDALLQAIQGEIERTVKPITTEKEDAIAHLCTLDGIKREDCDWDPKNEKVTRKVPPPKPEPAKPTSPGK